MSHPHHFYYYDPKRIDLSKLRAEAAKYASGYDARREPPIVVIIHHHDHDEQSCVGFEHERYIPVSKAASVGVIVGVEDLEEPYIVQKYTQEKINEDRNDSSTLDSNPPS